MIKDTHKAWTRNDQNKGSQNRFFNSNRSEQRRSKWKRTKLYNWYIAFSWMDVKKNLIIINDRVEVFSFSFVYHPSVIEKKVYFKRKFWTHVMQIFGRGHAFGVIYLANISLKHDFKVLLGQRNMKPNEMSLEGDYEKTQWDVTKLSNIFFKNKIKLVNSLSSYGNYLTLSNGEVNTKFLWSEGHNSRKKIWQNMQRDSLRDVLLCRQIVITRAVFPTTRVILIVSMKKDLSLVVVSMTTTDISPSSPWVH